MTKCTFCPRQATESLHGCYDVCDYCHKAFEEGFGCGRLYEADRPRYRDAQRHPKGRK